MNACRAPRLDADMVHVWIAATDLDGPAASELVRCLSDDERTRARRLRFDRDRRRFSVARAALRHILSAYLPPLGPSDVRFTYGAYGKPRLEGAEGKRAVQFNVAHSGDFAAFAITRDRAVGVDLERIRPELVDDGLARAVLTIAELDEFRRLSSEERARAFFRIWTCKEARLKARGIGLAYGLAAGASAEFGGSRIWPLSPAPGYVGAVAVPPEKTNLLCLSARFGEPFERPPRSESGVLSAAEDHGSSAGVSRSRA
jgi:4'-phosphopantetheinyl transferase